MTTDDTATELWLRRAGLPYFVRPGRRAHNLFGRITPFLVYLIAMDLTFVALDNLGRISLEADDAGIAALVIGIAVLALLILVGLPLLVAIVAARLLGRTARSRLPITLGIIAIYVLGLPWISSFAELWGSPAVGVLVHLGGVLLALLLTLAGVGSLLGWSAVTAVRLLGAIGGMTSLALPLLMLVVVFAFFARALWEVTSSMSWYRIEAVAAFFGLLVLLFLVPATRRQMRTLTTAAEPGARATLLERSGLSYLRRGPGDSAPPLSRGERGNITVVMVLAQGFQVMIFAAVVAFFLVVLGQLAFSGSVLSSWLQGPPPTIVLFGLNLPFDVALVKTAIFLGCVSGLNFAVSASTNAAYRSAFYDPLFDEARIALAVRDAYRGTMHEKE